MIKPNYQTALSALFQDRMGEHVQKAASRPPLELGMIQDDMSLKVDGLPGNIAEYLVARQLTLGETDDVLYHTQASGKPNAGKHKHSGSGSHGGHLAGDGSHSHGEDGEEHIHDYLIPEKMRWIKPGDRVLVAWVNNIPVVIDLVLDISEL